MKYCALQATETVRMNSPMCRINSKWSGLNIAPDDHTTRRTINMCHLHAPRARVHPVEIMCHPVDNNALWWVQVKVDNVFRNTSIHKCTADGLQQQQTVNCYRRRRHKQTAVISLIHSTSSPATNTNLPSTTMPSKPSQLETYEFKANCKPQRRYVSWLKLSRYRLINQRNLQ